MIVKILLLPFVVAAAVTVDVSLHFYNWCARRAGSSQISAVWITR